MGYASLSGMNRYESLDDFSRKVKAHLKTTIQQITKTAARTKINELLIRYESASANSNRLKIIYQLECVGRAALPTLVNISQKTDDAEIKDKLEAILLRYPEMFTQVLSDKLKEASEETICKAIAKLGKIKDRAIIGKLIELIDSPSAAVRIVTVYCLGYAEVSDAVPKLLHVVGHDSDKRVQKTAISALGWIRDTRALPILLDFLSHEDANYRFRAVKALGHMKDAQAVPKLIPLLDDKHEAIRERAASALGEIGDARAVIPLCSRLPSNDEAFMLAAAKALGDIGHADGTPCLIEVLKTPNLRLAVKHAALQAIGKIGQADDVSVIIGYAKGHPHSNYDDYQVRRDAIAALNRAT